MGGVGTFVRSSGAREDVISVRDATWRLLEATAVALERRAARSVDVVSRAAAMVDRFG